MTGRQKRKGDRAEREAAELLTVLLGTPVRRRLGAGRQDDTGDLDGLDGWVVQVADWGDTAAAVRIKPTEAEQQRINANAGNAMTMLRLRGGQWRIVLTPEQFARTIDKDTR